jgi:aspartate/methionine/tyrosine aminotransferase
MPTLAARTARISPFYVMEIVKAAAQLEAAGRSVIHMSIGEPDFTAPPPVQEAANQAIAKGDTAYTPALGLSSLREAIAAHYERAYGVRIDAGRIAITAGASGALLLAMAALVESGDEVLMPDPSYPCNRHFVSAFDGIARLVPCGPEVHYQLDAAAVRASWTARTRGVMLASPSNPTGTSISTDTLQALLDSTRASGGFSVVDEIYQGLVYDHPPRSALALSSDVLVINSFSKYFSMTGWRLGWLALPETLVPAVERLAQNLFICASTVAQRAALACFDPASLQIYETRRREFKRRRDFLVPELRRLGLKIPVEPDGAFYIYVDVGRFSADSWEFAFELLTETGVCVVPGRDFGTHAPQRYVRISYATAMDRLEEGIARMGRFLADRAPRDT